MHQVISFSPISSAQQSVRLENIAQHDVFMFISAGLNLDDVISLSTVNKFMNHIRLMMLMKVRELNMIGIRHPYSFYPMLRNVVMSLDCEELDAGLFPNLRSVYIRKGRISSDLKFARSLNAVFTEIIRVEWMTNLVELRIIDCSGYWMHLGMMNNLTSLAVSHNFPYWNAPNLKNLEWLEPGMFNDRESDYIDVSMLTKLERLVIEDSSAVGLENIKRLTCLKSIRSEVDYISTNLVELNIHSLDISFSDLSKLTGLTILESVEFPIVDDEIFNLTNIRSLYISIWESDKFVTSLEDLRNHEDTMDLDDFDFNPDEFEYPTSEESNDFDGYY